MCTVCAMLSVDVFPQDTDSLQCTLQTVVVEYRQGEQSAVPIQSFRAGQIEELGMYDLSDALKRMSGVDVHDYGGMGGLKTVSVRGLGAKHTSVSYDGVVVSDAQSGMVDLGRFPLENVGLVSLAIGEDEAWGARAARESVGSSLLRIKSLNLQESMAYVKLKGGSFGYAGVSAFANYASARKPLKSASLFANYMRSDGMYPFVLTNGGVSSREKRRDGDIRAILLDGNCGFALWGGDLSAKMHYYDSERGLPGAVNLYNKAVRERLWSRNFFAQAVYRRSVGDECAMQAILKYDYNYSRYREQNVNYAAGEQVDVCRQNEYYASVSFVDYCLGPFAYSVATDLSYATLANNFGNDSEPRRFSSYTAMSLWCQGWWGRVQAGLLAYYASDDIKGKASPARYRRLSPSLTFTYKPFINLPLRVRFSFKDSYRVPTFADLYYLRLGNVGLKPERATQFNLGFTLGVGQRHNGRLFIACDAFYNSVRDKIVALPTMYIWRMMNFGKAEIYGVDANLSFEMDLTERLGISCNANYSWQHAVDITDKTAKNYRDQLPYTPEHSGNFSLVFENPFVNVSYMLSVVGERYMLPQNTGKNRMQGYAEHSFSLNREFRFGGTGLRLQAEFLNVGDEKYEVIRYYPMPGFSWRLSAMLKF